MGYKHPQAETFGIVHATCVCTGLVVMALGFALCGIANLLSRVGGPSLPCDLFQV